MKRERRQTRPQVEGLESMTLLSNASAMMPHVVAVDVATAPAVPVAQTISISGTAHGFYFSHERNPDTGTTYNLFATGRLTPFGQSLVTGLFQTPGFILNGKAQGNLAVLSARGTVNLKITQIVPPPPTTATPPTVDYQFTYTITGGTRRYRNANGNGTLDAMVTPSGSMAGAGSFFAGSGRVTLTFHSSPTTTV